MVIKVVNVLMLMKDHREGQTRRTERKDEGVGHLLSIHLDHLILIKKTSTSSLCLSGLTLTNTSMRMFQILESRTKMMID